MLVYLLPCREHWGKVLNMLSYWLSMKIGGEIFVNFIFLFWF